MSAKDFEYDIYISYALADNTANNGQPGWVDAFQKFLEILLSQITGVKPVFLRYAGQEKPTASELIKSAVFISVVSPHYLKSAACIEEVDDFFQNAIHSNTLFINGTERVFKVVKYPVDKSLIPAKISNLLSYELYQINPQTNEISEFTDFFSNDAERKFWLKMVDLAYDISGVIKAYKPTAIKQQHTDLIANNNVYLAETGFDLQLHRDNIKRELVRHGFKIYPDHTLPTNPVELEVAIKKDLEKCRLSIHLIGDTYGELIPGTSKSVLDIQNTLAGEHSLIHSGANAFSRMIWISPDANLEDDHQRMFVDNLRRELEDNEGAEIMQCPIEDFKMQILDDLLGLDIQKIIKNSFQNPSLKSDKPLVYLIYDKIDELDAKPLADKLEQNNFNVILPNFHGDLLELREIHLNNLKVCDAAFIFINKVNDIWVKMKFLDLLKAPGLGRTKGILKKAIVLGNHQKENVSQYQKFDAPAVLLHELNIYELLSELFQHAKP